MISKLCNLRLHAIHAIKQYVQAAKDFGMKVPFVLRQIVVSFNGLRLGMDVLVK
jgi:hypothetical protein